MSSNEWTESPLIKQVWGEEEQLEMLLEGYKKYHDKLDFAGGF